MLKVVTNPQIWLIDCDVAVRWRGVFGIGTAGLLTT